MWKNPRVIGVLLWLLSLQVFAVTSGRGLLGEYLWLDAGTALIMFMAAAFLLGQGLTMRSQLSFAGVMALILIASAIITIRICGQLQLHWYNAMTIAAGPQVFAMAIGFWLGNRRDPAKMQLNR